MSKNYFKPFVMNQTAIRSNNVGKSYASLLNTLNNAQYNPLTKKEEAELIGKYQNEGDEKARERLIKSNMRFAVSVARQYVTKDAKEDDLFQCACIGLMIALDRFDLKTGNKLISYAVMWMRNECLYYVNNKSANIYTPFTKHKHSEQIEKLKKYKSEGFTTKEAAKKVKIQPSTAFNLLFNYNTKSTDEPVTNNKAYVDVTLIDILGECDSNDDSELYNKKRVSMLISQLSEDRKDIVQMFFGLAPYKYEHTLIEIGHKYGLTREATRQRINVAFKKLRKKNLQYGQAI